MRLSSSNNSAVDPYIQDYGNVYAPGTTTHTLDALSRTQRSLRRRHGALGVGPRRCPRRVQFEPTATVPRMQQATINLLADVGIQPGDRAARHRAVARTTDAPRSRASVMAYSLDSAVGEEAVEQVTISRSATDSGTSRA